MQEQNTQDNQDTVPFGTPDKDQGANESQQVTTQAQQQEEQQEEQQDQVLKQSGRESNDSSK